MSINAAEIERVAKLARLRLAPGEAGHFAAQLSNILDHFAAMSGIETTGVEPMAHPIATVARVRPDAVTESDQRNALQAGAPQVEDGYFLVPRVIE